MSQAPAAPASQPKTSGLAIGALVCSIAGIFTCGVGSIVGLILAIVAMNNIKKSAGQVGGAMMAFVALIVSAVGLVLYLLLALVFLVFIPAATVGTLMPAINQAKNQAYAVASMNNVNQLCMAAHMYANDNKEQFPPPDTWPAVLKEKQFIAGDQILAEPAAPAAGRAYAMNRRLAGVRVTDVRSPSQTVLFFECATGAPPAGGPENLPPQPRHGRGHVIGFCDGHAEVVPPNDLGRLLWDPKAEAPGR